MKTKQIKQTQKQNERDMAADKIRERVSLLPSPEMKISYLENVLKKAKLFSPQTLKFIYKLEGDLYVEQSQSFKEKFKKEYFRPLDQADLDEHSERRSQGIDRPLELASYCYERAEEFIKAAETATYVSIYSDPHGDYEEAAAMQEFKWASYSLAKRKAELYEKGGDKESAKKFRTEAAEEVLKAGEPEQALFEFLSIGETSKAESLFQKLYQEYTKKRDTKAAECLVRRFISKKSLTSRLN